MQFLYHKDAKNELLSLENEEFLHLKVRRVKLKEHLKLRNLEDEKLYTYEVTELNKHSCVLKLLKSEISPTTKSTLSLALAVIEPRILEKTLPFLNEFGVKKLIFVYTSFSQRNFKIDFARLEKILINSCEQCGRTDKIEFELFKNVEFFKEKYKEAILVDFSGEVGEFSKDTLYFIGPEGGFSEKERALFESKIRFKSTNILKTQSAIIAVAAKILV